MQARLKQGWAVPMRDTVSSTFSIITIVLPLLLLLCATLVATAHPPPSLQVPGGQGYDHNYVLFGMGPQAKYITRNHAAAST